MYLLVRADLFLLEPIISGLVTSSNKDMFRGVTMEKKSLIGYYVFEGDKDRIESIAFVFNKIREKHKIRTKSLVEIKRSIRREIIPIQI